jgi:hypothetical protein
MPFSGRNLHRAGLRPSFTIFLRKGDFLAWLETVKTFIQHAVAMKVDVASVRGLKEAETLFWKDPGDTAARRTHSRFDLSTASPSIVLQLPLRCLECVTNDHVKVFVWRLHVQALHPLVLRPLLHGAVKRRLVFNHQLLTRNSKINPDMVRVARAVMSMERLHHHAAARRPPVIRIQLGCLLSDPLLSFLRGVHISEGDLHGEYHLPAPPLDFRNRIWVLARS